jgi:hypothetical protein
MTTAASGPEDALPQKPRPITPETTPGMWPEMPSADAIDAAAEEAIAAAIDAYRAAEEERRLATPWGRLSTLWSMLPQWVRLLLIVLAFVAVAKGWHEVSEAMGWTEYVSCPEEMSEADCRDFLGIDDDAWSAKGP